MSITFSGWEVMHNRQQLKSNQTPKDGGGYTMFHGTSISLATTIINQGFQRSRDGLLGEGVYISRNIDKAKCYPLSTDRKDKVVFKLKVRVGKVKKIDCDNHPMQKSWHQNGYDCAWVPPKSKISSIKSGREEDCVWDPKRITVVDVACCVDDATRHQLRKLVKQKLKANSQGDGHASPHGCQLCHADVPGSHPRLSCWECGKDICPFQSKHPCKKAA
ncbi:GCRV-induced gene 2o [Amia ocellicauda]|uniref:GCRV-induced gene 2o n=1 Tax=Amia ocellicauda TaxID=2972642 RepID=UPI0034638D58